MSKLSFNKQRPPTFKLLLEQILFNACPFNLDFGLTILEKKKNAVEYASMQFFITSQIDTDFTY